MTSNETSIYVMIGPRITQMMCEIVFFCKVVHTSAISSSKLLGHGSVQSINWIIGFLPQRSIVMTYCGHRFEGRG